MRLHIPVLALLLLPTASFAQTKEMVDEVERKLAAIKFVLSVQNPDGGFAPNAVPASEGLPSSLRATSAAVRALKYLSGKPAKEAVPNADKTAAFVMSCFDPGTGGFADTPKGKPDVTLTSVGVMAAVELEIPKDKFRKAMDYLKKNAKSFEDVRIGAAAVEAWGVKDCPFDLKPWLASAAAQTKDELPGVKDGGARLLGSVAAMTLRLGAPVARQEQLAITDLLQAGQRDDGGWGKKDAKASDLETTYRVMRAFVLLKAKPADAAKLRAFVGKCRNADGGSGTAPGEKSSVGGVYFATIVTKWLDE